MPIDGGLSLTFGVCQRSLLTFREPHLIGIWEWSVLIGTPRHLPAAEDTYRRPARA
jgi:hypothetical protein